MAPVGRAVAAGEASLGGVAAPSGSLPPEDAPRHPAPTCVHQLIIGQQLPQLLCQLRARHLHHVAQLQAAGPQGRHQA
jgi:hypothetical protein